MPGVSRRSFAVLLASFAAVSGGAVFAQDNYPDKPVHLVVPYPPGGFTDILGRLLAQKLQAGLGQSVIVDNKGGGGSSIGSAYVAHAPADGYTLLLVAPDLAINESLMPARLTYDARKDFEPIMQVAWSPMVLVVGPSLQVKSVAELIALGKAKPGTINVASGGNGTGSHLALELFKTRAGINLTHIPYKGNGPATTDLLGGQVGAMFLQYAVAKPYLDSGKLHALATPGDKRIAALPDVPTIAESGLPDFDVQPWFGVVAPTGTPKSVINRLNKEMSTIMKAPWMQARLSELGATATVSTPQAFGRFIDSEITRWAQVVKVSGAKVE